MTTRRRRKKLEARQKQQQECKRPSLVARTDGQREYMRSIRFNEMTFVQGPAGTGKTHVAVGMALQMIEAGQIDRIIFTRPLVCVGKDIGYLPGDINKKVGPYVTPCFDELRYYLSHHEIHGMLNAGVIDIVPLSMMRGRTFNRAFVLLDEAQNAGHIEVKTLLTRIGAESRFVVAGDAGQSDLPSREQGAFSESLDRLKDTDGIGIVHLGHEDIVRNPLIKVILQKLW